MLPGISVSTESSISGLHGSNSSWLNSCGRCTQALELLLLLEELADSIGCAFNDEEQNVTIPRFMSHSSFWKALQGNTWKAEA